MDCKSCFYYVCFFVAKHFANLILHAILRHVSDIFSHNLHVFLPPGPDYWKKFVVSNLYCDLLFPPVFNSCSFFYFRGSQPGVHVPLGTHLLIWRDTFKVSSKRDKYIYMLFVYKYLYIYQWILFSIIYGYMLICRNAEGIHDQTNFGNPCSI